MAKKDKVFCGSGKQQTKKWFKATIKPKILMEYLQTYKGAEFTRININLLDEPDKFGKDVEITIDTWQPTPNKDQVDMAGSKDDDLPF
jgi:hypothetical protein